MGRLHTVKSFLYSAPYRDETLSPDDDRNVFAELYPARHKLFALGLKFQVPYATLEYIHSRYSDRSSRFMSVIREFLNKGPNPTWRIIVDALRSPIVNLPLLANVVEAAHFPELTSNQPETTPTGEFEASYLYTAN